MTLTISLSPNVHARLSALARAARKEVPRYVEDLLAEQAATVPLSADPRVAEELEERVNRRIQALSLALRQLVQRWN